MDEILDLDAMGQAKAVREGDLSARELIEAVIARIERVNPKVNAVVTPLFDEARREIAQGIPAGPFAGVPFLLKDLLAEYAGSPLTAGSAFVAGYRSLTDSELVTRYRRAGLVVVGKTNTSEFGILPTTEPRLHGPTRNPWDLGRTAGGSSGGSAAAVAAGMVAMAHGSDAGGSIRSPASCCGVFGLKPTRARNPLGPRYGDLLSGLVVEHALTRSVRDSAALLDATAGPDLGDPYCAPPPIRPYCEEVATPPGKLYIAFCTATATGVPVHPDCTAAVRDAARLCAALGHEVEEARPVLDGDVMSRGSRTLWSGAVAWMVEACARLTGQTPSSERFEPLTWALYEMGRQCTASEYLFAVEDLQRVSREVARFLAGHDVWLTPTLAEPPPPLGAFDPEADNPLQGLLRAGRFTPFTSICNITGQPAMSVPLYWNAEGLPIGSHFVGRFGDEATLFRLAGQLEAAQPWAARRPLTGRAAALGPAHGESPTPREPGAI
jgi:amidase